jgi:hypothetical protein
MYRQVCDIPLGPALQSNVSEKEERRRGMVYGALKEGKSMGLSCRPVG